MFPTTPLMRHTMRRAAIAAVLGAALAHADPLQEILTTGAASAEAGRSAQASVDLIADDTRALAAEYATLRRQLDGLAVYNDRLEHQIADQQRRLAEIAQASSDATALSREMVPLLSRMIDSLDTFIGLDKPFRLEERRARIAQLHAGLGSTDMSVAASFRAVLDAYRTELAYGGVLGASTGTIRHDRAELTVSVLQVGRLALFAQSEDGATTFWWNPHARRWTLLEDDDFAPAVADGIRMARGELPPALLRLPIGAPEAGGK